MKTTTFSRFVALLILLVAGLRVADAQTVTVALSGDTAPGTSDNFTGFGSPVLNDMGQTVFSGHLNSSTEIDRGIWSEGGGSGLALVARRGNVAPGTSDTFAFSLFPFLGGMPVLNDSGQTAFSGSLNGSSTTDRGIWSEGGGSGLALVARKGNAAPGTNETFSFFSSSALNDAGQTAFFGRLNSSNTTDEGIWSEGGGSGLALVARKGNVAPGTSDTFSNFGRPGSSFTSLVINDAGQTAFVGSLNSSFVNYRGIWAEDKAGALTLIARTGDLLDVDDGPGTDFRTIRWLGFSGGTGNGDGRRSGFNNLGQLAFHARFTDGTSGIFISNLVAVPEPSTLLLGALACMGVLMRRNFFS